MNMRSVSLVAALSAFPLVVLGAPATSCKAGPPTAESYRWNFPREASRLLSGVQVDASKIETRATQLMNWDMNPSITWQLYSDQLMMVRKEVNDMGRKLCRLREIRSVVEPWQRAAIDRAGVRIQLLADNAQDAILFTNRYETNFWRPAYRRYADNIYHQSRRLANTMGEYMDYAKTQNPRLGHELGLAKSNS